MPVSGFGVNLEGGPEPGGGSASGRSDERGHPRAGEVVNSNSTVKTVLFWLFIIVLGVLLWKMVSSSGQSASVQEPSYSEFMAQVDRGNVKEVTLYLSPTSYDVEGLTKD